MKKTVIIIIVICLFSLYTMAHSEENSAEQTSSAPAEAIPNRFFQDVPPSLFVDLKAAKVGDIVTVLVMESASATKNASTKTSKSSTRGLSSSLEPVKGSLESESEHNGSGSTSRSGEITAKVPAIVTSHPGQAGFDYQ